MKVVREYFIATVFSWEFLVLLSGVCLLFFPNQVQIVSSMLQDNEETLKYIALLPSGMAAWVFNENKKLLFPEEDKNAILQQWPDYWRLKIYFKVSLAYALLFAVIGISVWFLGYKISQPIGFVPLVVSVIGGFVVVVSTYFAKITQKEILLGSRG